VGRKAKGPKIAFQFADQQQQDAVDRAADEDETNRVEMIRRFIDYGLAAREKARSDEADSAR
jgi:hypothetical protein